NKHMITPINKRIGKSIDFLLAASRYDIGVLRRALDATFRHSDTKERIKLQETLISHHVTAMNVTRNDPAIFFHYKNPETGKTEHVSDPDFDLDDLSTASSAAPTIFEVHQARNGDHYTDIAFFDTPQTCINSLHGQTNEKLDIRLVMLGTGKVDQEIDVKRLNSMLFLQQLIGRLGRHLLGLPQRFIMKRDLISLKQSLGAENVIEIDYQVNRFDLHKKHEKDPRVQRLASHLGINLHDRDYIAEIARLETHNLFDSSPEAIETLVKTGWDMVWDNLDTILPLAKDLVRNSQSMGHISTEEADSRISLIEHFMAAADPAQEAVRPPSLDDFKISKSKCKQWLTFEEVHKRDLSEKFRYLARRAIGRESDFIPPPPHVIDASRKSKKDKTPDDPGNRPK
ncbi:MAG: phospholipase, partial [Micavibrio aeruginosavorus]|nr:phospholipase [Micavibrio aeruginosavorus]